MCGAVPGAGWRIGPSVWYPRRRACPCLRAAPLERYSSAFWIAFGFLRGMGVGIVAVPCSRDQDPNASFPKLGPRYEPPALGHLCNLLGIGLRTEHLAQGLSRVRVAKADPIRPAADTLHVSVNAPSETSSLGASYAASCSQILPNSRWSASGGLARGSRDLGFVVGARGFEPLTSSASRKRSPPELSARIAHCR